MIPCDCMTGRLGADPSQRLARIKLKEPLINLRIMAHCAFDFEGDSMDGQLSFATLDYVGKKKRTKRDVFLRSRTHKFSSISVAH